MQSVVPSRKKTTQSLIKSVPHKKKSCFFPRYAHVWCTLPSRAQRGSGLKRAPRCCSTLTFKLLHPSVQTPAARAFTHLSLSPCAVFKGGGGAAGTPNTPSVMFKSPLRRLHFKCYVKRCDCCFWVFCFFPTPEQVGFLPFYDLGKCSFTNESPTTTVTS